MSLLLERVAVFLVTVIALLTFPAAEAREPYRYPENWFVGRALFQLNGNDTQWREDGLQQEFDAIARRVEKAMGLPVHFVDVDVMSCSIRRATAYAGGAIKVCLPFAIDVESTDEIAFVLAHEISHIAYDHTSTRGKRTSDDFAYSAAFEFAADATALDVIVEMGYSPEGASLFFEKFSRMPGEASSDPHMVERAKRIQQTIESRYLDVSESRELAPLSQQYQQASDFAAGYMAELGSLYEFYVAARLTAANAETGYEGDTIRSRACLTYYDRLAEMADRLGYTEALAGAATSAYVACAWYNGIDDRFGSFIAKHVKLGETSTNLLAALMMSIRTSSKKGLDVEIAKELHRRIFEGPTAIPSISPDLRRRFVAAHTHAVFSTGCDIMGSYNIDRTDRAYFGMAPEKTQWLRTRADSKPAFDTWLNGCIEARDFARADQKEQEERIYRSRLKSGHSPEDARNIAILFSRIELIPKFMSDALAINRIVKLNEERRDAQRRRQ